MASLDQQTVDSFLQHYESTGGTDERYSMGKTLMEECMERVYYLDAKSITIAGYTGAVIGLMVSTFPIWTSAVSRWAMFLVALGSLAGLIGGGMALASAWPRKFLLASDTDWLEQDGLGDPDRLKRYYISSMHQAIVSHEKDTARKVSKIKIAQACLAVMLLSLLVALGNATYKTAMRTSQPSSGRVGAAASVSPR